MSVLDDAAMLSKIDPGGMAALISRFPEMMKEARSIAPALVPAETDPGFKNILFCGMGGSAISADISSNLISKALKVPSAVSRGYEIPRFTGPDTLVFVLSYSGNTEETLSCYEAAARSGAKIVAVTSGGRLGSLASSNGNILFSIPEGFPPRASMPYLLVPVISVLSKLFPEAGLAGQLDESISVLGQMAGDLGPGKPQAMNAAKKIAGSLIGRIPYIFGSHGGSDAAAYRWKCQISENSKMNSCHNVFPELDHNEIVNLAGKGSKDIFVVLLRDGDESDKMKKRIDVTRKIIESSTAGVAEVHSAGRSLLARMLSLCYFGDFVSLYLAVLGGEDPMPVKAIDRLKQELGK